MYQNQQTETEERDWDEDDTDGVVDIMENEQDEKVLLPMQPMEVARETMEGPDEMTREQERLEVEQEDE